MQDKEKRDRALIKKLKLKKNSTLLKYLANEFNFKESFFHVLKLYFDYDMKVFSRKICRYIRFSSRKITPLLLESLLKFIRAKSFDLDKV